MATFISLFDMDWIEPVKPCTKEDLQKTPDLIVHSRDWVLIARGNIIEGTKAEW